MEEFNLIFNRNHRMWKIPFGNSFVEFKESKELLSFLKEEVNIWKDNFIGNNSGLFQYYNNLYENLNNSIQSFSKTKNQSQFDSILNEIHYNIQNNDLIKFNSKTDLGMKVLFLNPQTQTEANAIMDYFRGNFNGNRLNKEYFSGYIKTLLLDNPQYFPGGIEEIFIKGKELNSEMQKSTFDTISKSNNIIEEFHKTLVEYKNSSDKEQAKQKKRIDDFEVSYKDKFSEVLFNYEEKLRISGRQNTGKN
ncbi:hypothetical protein [Leptospira stimsonii]|uniref:Uncharacterized protein n=1 Tax=Leptospira stimsonii TaxID=2202203 RepID=A0A396YTK3_9LEPT|nr:hypothetical protein [Leptospira stimsonii]RHX84694.1 hypothetical protein DLM75_21990 [Leptospira stimsonii]